MVNDNKDIKKFQPGILFFSITEILIGSIALGTTLYSLLTGTAMRSPEVVIFILGTAIISTSLGFGILRLNINAYHLLLFFSTVIILSKILIFARIISLNDSLETVVPSPIKNSISIIYHSLIIFYFTRKPVKKQFGEHSDVFFYLKLPFVK
jgi:hypothetical protein